MAGQSWKIFNVNNKLISYRWPLTKAALSLLTIIALYYISNSVRDHIINEMIDFVIGAIFAIVCVICIIIIYIAWAEMDVVSENRRNKNTVELLHEKTINIPYTEVINMIMNNDVIKIIINIEGKIIRIGSSSYYDNVKDVFTEKKYYIDEDEYNSVDFFKFELNKIVKEREIQVVSIDDVFIGRSNKSNIWNC